MRQLSRLFGLAALIAAAVSCGDVSRQGRSPVYLIIDSLSGANGNTILSDVSKLVTSGGSCTVQAPCTSTTNDMATVVLSTQLKDVTNPSSPNAPTANNDVTIYRYKVSYRRADGRNTPGVDVPFGFDGAMTGTIASHLASTLGLSFEIVRHVAKEESPLVQLVNSASIITTIADVTIFGRDRVGNELSVTGSISINFGNFADTP